MSVLLASRLVPVGRFIGAGGLLFSLIYLETINVFEGFGGKLGIMANLSLITVFGLSGGFKKSKEKE